MLGRSKNTQHLPQQVADQIADLIRARKMDQGSRLPAERDLASQFAVSRSTIREALLALEITGLIDVRIRSGAFVSTDIVPAEITTSVPASSSCSPCATRRAIV
jgi:GntR family transcriptional repressor for pyruvate dehydrogenase complex